MILVLDDIRNIRDELIRDTKSYNDDDDFQTAYINGILDLFTMIEYKLDPDDEDIKGWIQGEFD